MYCTKPSANKLHYIYEIGKLEDTKAGYLPEITTVNENSGSKAQQSCLQYKIGPVDLFSCFYKDIVNEWSSYKPAEGTCRFHATSILPIFIFGGAIYGYLAANRRPWGGRRGATPRTPQRPRQSPPPPEVNARARCGPCPYGRPLKPGAARSRTWLPPPARAGACVPAGARRPSLSAAGAAARTLQPQRPRCGRGRLDTARADPVAEGRRGCWEL